MIKLFRDDEAKSIFIEDNVGAQFPNSLQAIKNTDNTISIIDLARSIEIVSNELFSEFINEFGGQYGQNPDETVNALNVEFTATGTASSEQPLITSPLGVSLTQGETLNYELTADYGVGYEWDLSNVPGITTVDGNPRKLIGGSSLATGDYAIPARAINYNGQDTQIIELSIGSPPFANTKSVQFNSNDYLIGNAGVLQSALGRSGNGSGASDAWTICFYFKPGTSSNAAQTIFYYGSQDVNNGAYIQVKYVGTGNTGKKIEFRYGSNNNRLTLVTPVDSLVVGQWSHVMISYDGGTTGSSSGQINNYYSRFKIFIDGAQITTTNTNNNFGTTTALTGQNLRVGRFNNGQSLRNNCRIDELAIYAADVSAEISSIYNGGVAVDLMGLSTQPEHWWRMGDGDSFPYLFDVGYEASCIFVMQNMTAADIISDTPQ